MPLEFLGFKGIAAVVLKTSAPWSLVAYGAYGIGEVNAVSFTARGMEAGS